MSAQKEIAAELMDEVAAQLNALVMLEELASSGLLSVTLANDCTSVRDRLAQRANELRDTERGLLVQFGQPNRMRRAG